MAISHGGVTEPAPGTGHGEHKTVGLSRSACLRERGNTLYREATSETSIPGMRSCRLQDAIRLYSQALSLSQTNTDKAMCCKNLGQAFWARAKLTLVLAEQKRGTNRGGGSLISPSSPDSDKVFDSLCFDLLSSVSYFLDALGFSRPDSQSKEWVQGIHWTLVDIAWTVDDIRESSPMGGRVKDRFLAELCAVFQQKLPSANVKLQASAIVHKACAKNGLKNAINLEPRFAKVPVLQDCLFQLSVAQSHTDSTAVAFLDEIASLRGSIVRQIELCEDMGARLREQNRSFGASEGNRGWLKRNQSYSEDRSQSAQSRMLGGRNQTDGRCSSLRVNRVSSPQPSDVERMFNLLSPVEFLRAVYLNYPPPGRRESRANLGEIRSMAELRIAYKRAISHYHPDHHDSKQAKLSDEITKYLIMNLNALKAE